MWRSTSAYSKWKLHGCACELDPMRGAKKKTGRNTAIRDKILHVPCNWNGSPSSFCLLRSIRPHTYLSDPPYSKQRSNPWSPPLNHRSPLPPTERTKNKNRFATQTGSRGKNRPSYNSIRPTVLGIGTQPCKLHATLKSLHRLQDQGRQSEKHEIKQVGQSMHRKARTTAVARIYRFPPPDSYVCAPVPIRLAYASEFNCSLALYCVTWTQYQYHVPTCCVHTVASFDA